MIDSTQPQRHLEPPSPFDYSNRIGVQSSLLSRTGPDGKPLYVATESGNIRRARKTPQKRKDEAKARDGWRCVQCSAVRDLEVDHIIPYGEGGSDDLDNLRTLCRSCHVRRRRGDSYGS